MPRSPQATPSIASSLSTSGVGNADSSFIHSSVTNTVRAPPGLDPPPAVAPSDISAAYTTTVPATSPPTTTLSPMTPTAYDPTPFGSTGISLTTQSGGVAFTSVPVDLHGGIPRPTCFHYGHHRMGAPTPGFAPHPMFMRFPMATPCTFSIGSQTITGTGSTGAVATDTGPSYTPQQTVSRSNTANTQTTQSRPNFVTTATSGNLLPIPTTTSNGSSNTPSNPNRLLPLILGLVVGVLVIIALGMAVFRCPARRRSKNLSNVLASGSSALREPRERTMTEDTPRVIMANLGQRITSYGRPSIFPSEHVTTRTSHASESSQISHGQSSDPFADSAEISSSRTSMHPASIHSVESLSMNLAFTVSMNADPRDVEESGELSDASTSDLELHFVTPLVPTDGSTTRLPYLSSSWHYDSPSPASSPRQRENWNAAQDGISPVSFRVSSLTAPRPFSLGTGNARLHLHALLEEARRI